MERAGRATRGPCQRCTQARTRTPAHGACNGGGLQSKRAPRAGALMQQGKAAIAPPPQRRCAALRTHRCRGRRLRCGQRADALAGGRNARREVDGGLAPVLVLLSWRRRGGLLGWGGGGRGGRGLRAFAAAAAAAAAAHHRQHRPWLHSVADLHLRWQRGTVCGACVVISMALIPTLVRLAGCAAQRACARCPLRARMRAACGVRAPHVLRCPRCHACRERCCAP